MNLRAIHLFAGAGGSVLAGRLLGFHSLGYVEWDAFCQRVLDKHGEVKLGTDIAAFDARPWRGHVDILMGGPPCQDLSTAGKRAGLEGEKSRYFWDMARNIEEAEPTFAFYENVRGVLSSNGGKDFGLVLRAFHDRGYDCHWEVLSAAHAGAPHLRERVWILAHRRDRADAIMRMPPPRVASPDGLSDAAAERLMLELSDGLPWPAFFSAWPAGRGQPQHSWEPPRTVPTKSTPNRVARLKALGNGWVPQTAVLAFTRLWARMQESL